MKAKRKRRKRRSKGHNPNPLSLIVSNPLREAFEAMVTGRLAAGRGWVCPSTSEAIGRLTGGRVKRSAARHWVNGSRRAPSWFVAVLIGEVQRRADHLLAIGEKLAAYEVRDPERERALKAARMRERHRVGDARFNARKRASGAVNEDSGGKNDPHN